MRTKTERLALWGAVSVLGFMGVGGAGLARNTVRDPRALSPSAVPATTTDSTQQALQATRADLLLARLEIERTEAILGYSTRYRIDADLATTIYDLALAEGVEPALAFSLVRTESNFTPTAQSPAGAIGYTQILLSTARLYEPGLTARQLYGRTTNLHLGFRYLRDLLERYEGTSEPRLELALLAYNRGPARVQALLAAGRDPRNGYSTTVLKRYRKRG
ncbi:MAG TPA: transglycosylase SLT domain-containing protein [Gemmatimonadales bacterium]|nr:transglycosylase SLT domain-containing protein [Gemmatimonadales bacterium]